MSTYEEFHWVAELDLDNSGTFATDISPYLLRVEELQEGRRSTREPFGPASGVLVLDNADRRFTPRNTGSPYSPDFKRWKPVRLRAQFTNLSAVAQLDDNPSVENDIVGWTVVGVGSTGSQQGDTARYGKKYYQAFFAGNPGDHSIIRTKRDGSRFAVASGNDFTASVWCQQDQADSFKFEVEWYTTGGSLISTATSPLFTPGNWWERQLFTATAPALSATARVLITTTAPAAAIRFDCDGFNFAQQVGSAEMPYVDGDQPGSAWNGTAHESPSNRPANPYFGFLLGEITDIELSRGEQATCRLRVRGHAASWARKPINLAHISGQKGHLALERALDIIEGDLGITESAFNDYRSAGSTTPRERDLWVEFTNGGTPGVVQQSTVAFEGQTAQRYTYPATGAVSGQGLRRDVTSITANEVDYDLVAHLIDSIATTNDIRFELADQAGPILGAATDTNLTGTYQRAKISAKQWPATSTTRYIQAVSTGVEAATAFILDAWQIQKSSLKLTRRMDGTTYDIDWVAGYRRSATAILSELAASAGGWLREELGDSPATTRTIVFEDINNRPSTPIPIRRFTDRRTQDGLPYDSSLLDAEREADNFTVFRVASLGDLVTGGSVEVWRLEPTGLSFTANETKRIYMNPFTVRGGDPTITLTFSAGGGDAYAKMYSVGGFIDVTKDGTAGNLDSLVLTGIPAKQEATERVFTEVDKRPDIEVEPARVMEIDMLGQGRLTSAMTAVRDYFANRYYHGGSRLELTMTVATVDEALLALGTKLSAPIRVIHDEGPGNYALDADFYVEGRLLEQSADDGVLRVTLVLEPA